VSQRQSYSRATRPHHVQVGACHLVAYARSRGPRVESARLAGPNSPLRHSLFRHGNLRRLSICLKTRERLRERKSAHKVLNDERTDAEKKAQKKENDNLIRGHKVEVRAIRQREIGRQCSHTTLQHRRLNHV